MKIQRLQEFLIDQHIFCLKDGETYGDCDGRFLGTRYFSASPKSSVFTTAKYLLLFSEVTDEGENLTYPQVVDNRTQNTISETPQSAYFPQKYSPAFLNENQSLSASKTNDGGVLSKNIDKMSDSSDIVSSALHSLGKLTSVLNKMKMSNRFLPISKMQ